MNKDELIKKLTEENTKLKELLECSEQYRNYYRKGKLELYSMGGQITDAVMKCLPCSEGALERQAVKALGKKLGWIELSEYDLLKEKLNKT